MRIKDEIKGRLWYFPAAVYVNFFYFYKVRRGYGIYKRIVRKKPGSRLLCLCPYKGTGDVYLAAGLLPDYLAAQGLRDIQLAVIGNGNRKIAGLFGFDDAEAVSQEEMDLLVRFALAAGLEHTGIKILHPDALNMHTGICDRLRNYQGLNFIDMYARVLYGLSDYRLRVPAFAADREKIRKLFFEKSLQPHKTVLLAPYSNTINQLPLWAWIRLSERLKELGYCVCTNCASSHEIPIRGTTAVVIQYEDLKEFLLAAGYFIGIRSGLCEIISSIPCKKIILNQPDIYFGPGTNFDYFNLKHMGLCGDAVELEWKGIAFYELIDEIEKALVSEGETENGRR